MKDEKEIKYFSMFTGVGGFELGLEGANNNREFLQEETNKDFQKDCSNIKEGQTRFTCVGFSEIEKYANQLLNKKFPAIKNYGDATKINPDELPEFDMLCGGFPCQSFSIAGKRRGFQDTRGTLFFDIARIIKVKRPKIILLENVKGLLNHDKGQTFKVILQTLSELGYDVQWMVLNSKFFGVPQNRERLFIIGNISGKPRTEILPFRENDLIFIKENESKKGQSQTQISSTIGEKIMRADKTFIMENVIPVLTPERKNKRQKGRRFKEEGDPSFTLTGQDIHGVLDGMRIRRLTPKECERLQGFPDDWTDGFSDSQRYKMMGNAVTVNVIKSIGEILKNVKV